MCLDCGSGKGKSGVLTDEELGAFDEHGDRSLAGKEMDLGEEALSPRGKRQGREVRVLLGQETPLVPPQGSAHLRATSQVEESRRGPWGGLIGLIGFGVYRVWGFRG